MTNITLNYMFIFIVMIFYSGLHLVLDPVLVMTIFILVLTPLAFLNLKNVLFDKNIFILLSLLSISTLVTYVTFDPSSIAIEGSAIITLFIMYLLVSSYKANFLISFVKIIHYLSVVSILAWISLEITDSIFDTKLRLSDFALNYGINEGGRYTLFLFNYGMESNRNYGMFWEPSVLALFVFTSLLLQEFLKIRNVNFPRHYVLIAYLTIISTQSTGGYIYMFLHFLFFNTTIQKNKGLLYPLVLIMGMIAFTNISFLQEKIIGFINDSDVTNEHHYFNGRLNFTFMMSLFLQEPIFGIGQRSQLLSAGIIEGSLLNGYLSILVTYGIFVFIFYNFLLLKSALIWNKDIINMRLIGFIVCFIIMNMNNGFTYAPNFYLPVIIAMVYSQSNDFFKEYN